MDEQQWREFRQYRESNLAEEYGWLALRGFHWLPQTPQPIEALPGRWWSDGENAHLEATAGDDLLVDQAPVDGRATMTVAETSRVSWVRWGDMEIELLRRGGRLTIRLRGRTSPHREAFAGVPTYPYDPDWVVTARFLPYDGERRVDVATHRPELRQRLLAPGEVEFSVGGQLQRLVATNIKAGLSIEFHDPTNGTETEAWRQLKFADPAEDGTVRLDFNRTINMWFAFSDHVTCPMPVEGNTITVPVRAGERAYPRPV